MLLWLIFCNILFLGICLNIKSKSLSGWQCRAALPRQQTALFLSLFGLAIKCLFSALYNGPYMIWRSNITVWNSHDVLLLLFTSTLGVIIEVNIFYTNTIPRGLSFIEVRPESKQQTFTLCFWFWWCPEGSQGWFGGICVWPGEENLFFVYQFLWGVCVCFQYFKYWTVRCPKCSVKSKCDHSCCSQCEGGTFTDSKYLGSDTAKGDCFEHHSNISIN